MPSIKKQFTTSINQKSQKKLNAHSNAHSNAHTNTTSKTSKASKRSSVNVSLDKYIPPKNNDIIPHKYWELPNRKTFYNWINAEFGQYEIGNTKKQTIYKPRIKEHFELSNLQRLTRDYLQDTSPARGLLLYFGLGTGKTCSAITIAEAIISKKQVVIFCNKNLKSNWIKGIRDCGADYVKTYNYWVFHRHNIESDASDASGASSASSASGLNKLINELGIPKLVIKTNGGVFLIDFTKNTSNYNDLDEHQKAQLDIQIESTINAGFEFVVVDSPTLGAKLDILNIDNKIIIWDESHNLGNRIASNSVNGIRLYNLFMNAINVKILFLSGTPIINRIFEITKIFNILRGYMHVLEIQFKSTFTTTIDYKKLEYNLKANKYVDQIIINKHKKIIKITKNPDNFITSNSNGNSDGNSDGKGKGLIYKPEDNIDFDKFTSLISKIIQSMGYKINITAIKTTCFPEDEEIFDQIFFSKELNKIKRPDLIKRRIAGLTSYYEYQDKTNYPELKPRNIIQVPMSEFQLGTYERFRHKEIEKDKNARRHNNPEDNDANQSSYRLKSRLACSFAFPEEIGNPFDTKLGEEYIEYIENLGNKLESFDITASQAGIMTRDQIDKKIKIGYAQLLDHDKAKYLDIKNGSLAKYSPKYLTMILNIQKQALIGKILVYSFFNNLVGLNIFSYALIQTGKWAPFRIKKVNKIWELDEREDEKHKFKFAFYTGNQDSELRDIYRKIINTDWDSLGANCNQLVKQLKAIHPNNYYGEIIKMLMINKTGAEGLDLKEIRFINITESFWQDVLIEQIIGRGVRNKSHLTLPLKDRNVEVFIYLATFTPNLVRKISYVDVRNDIYKYPNPILNDKFNKVITSDEHLYLTADRKKIVIGEFQKLMKESAFDCSLNYKENKLNPANNKLVCMDYSTKNRDDYLFTPSIEDTSDGIDVAQEKIITEKYGKKQYKDKMLFYELTPNVQGKMYVYNENLVGKVRLPKPIGEVKIINGKRTFLLWAKKK